MTQALKNHLLQLERFASGEEFLSKARAFLLENEALNNMTLGVAEAAPASPSAAENAYWAIASDLGTNTIVMTAMHTEPRPVVLSGSHEEAARTIANDLLANESEREITGALGLPGPAQSFAEIIVKSPLKNIQNYSVRMRHGAYQLSQVIHPKGIEGQFRPARIEEAPLLEQWAVRFAHDARHEDEAEIFRASIKPRIGAQFLYVWERRGEVVSMASLGRFTPNGAVISLVYTPKEHRGKGFGASVTASLSAHCLKQGKRYCFLYADLDNPASNKIYKAMGYELQAEWLLLAFKPS